MNKLLLAVILLVGLATLVFGISRVMMSTTATSDSDVPTITTFKNGYLPLGDSYTIGEAIPASGNFPNQLVDRLRTDVPGIGIVANESVTGYTTADVISQELPLVAQTKPTFVTILIGVNDYVQGVSAQTFEKNLRYIVTTTQQNMSQPKNIILLTIPDYAKTPSGAQYGDPANATTAIANFNAIIKRVAQETDLPVVDIFPVSQQVSSNVALTATDGLHPSAQQYTLWTDVLYPVVKSRISFN